MFFADRIQSVRTTDRVLEVGPGGTPHPRADVFLEKEFADERTAAGQRGHTQPLRTDRPVLFYPGGRFPFRDREFDYVICSHVLEHVDDVDRFLVELSRVAGRGYLEFPTVYYEYLYDFAEHTNCLFWREQTVLWMPKRETCLAAFRPVTRFYYESLCAGYTSLVDALKPLLFQGFEWEGQVASRRTRQLHDLCYGTDELSIPPASPPRRRLLRRLQRWRRAA
jgi:hypothetical protein